MVWETKDYVNSRGKSIINATKWVPIRLNGVSSGRPHTKQLGSYIIHVVGLYFTSFVGAEVMTQHPQNMPSPFSRFGVVR
jgi:hypothetical protein